MSSRSTLLRQRCRSRPRHGIFLEDVPPSLWRTRALSGAPASDATASGRRGLLLLSQAEAGKNYSVSGIYERDRHLLEFLEHRGIRPGAHLHVSGRNYDQTLTLATGAGTVALGGAAAERVWVTGARAKSRPVSSHSSS